MDVIHFFKWWWKQRDSAEKVLFVFVFWAIVTLPGMIFYGFSALLIFFGGLALSIISYILFIFYKSMRKEWDRFKVEREREAERIIERLGGTIQKKSTAETILDKIRARRNTTV